MLADVRLTSLVAGAGYLFVLADRDRIVTHINNNSRANEPKVQSNASDDEIEAALKQRSDAPDKLHVSLLKPNTEGLIATIGTCAPGLLPPDTVAAAAAKDLFARERVLSEAAKPAVESIRACIRELQPGLDRLAQAIARTLPADAIT